MLETSMALFKKMLWIKCYGALRVEIDKKLIMYVTDLQFVCGKEDSCSDLYESTAQCILCGRYAFRRKEER